MNLKSIRYKNQTSELKCPKCSGSDFWKTGDFRFKCKSCRHIFKPKINPFNLSDSALKGVISELLLGHSINVILERIDISKFKLLKILNFLRVSMTNDIPEVFKKMVKLQNYLSNRKTNPPESRESDMNINRPIIGILCKEGWVYAKILPNVEVNELKSFIKNRREINSAGYQEEWQKYFGLIFKNSLYRLFVSEGQKHQIDAMEAFWGYLKRSLAAKGGIRKEKLPLYLEEYVWKYNHRKLPLEKKEEILLDLVFKNLCSADLKSASRFD